MRVAGFGFRKAAGLDSLLAAYERAGGAADVLATAASKIEGLMPLARRLGLPLIGVSVQDMAAQAVVGSRRVQGLHGTGSVAEASALAAAGPGARLVAAKVASADGMAVAAVAEGPGR